MRIIYKLLCVFSLMFIFQLYSLVEVQISVNLDLVKLLE